MPTRSFFPTSSGGGPSGFAPHCPSADAFKTARHSSLCRSAFTWYNSATSFRRTSQTDEIACSVAALPA
eukprot:5661416-Pyramimonas_sp.AAC.1